MRRLSLSMKVVRVSGSNHSSGSCPEKAFVLSVRICHAAGRVSWRVGGGLETVLAARN